MFDDQGRPRAIVRYQTLVGTAGHQYIHDWHYKSFLAYQEKSYINAMSYFPVIVKRDHLPLIRQAMLSAHPEFTYFDELYTQLLIDGKSAFSQFTLMFDYLWKYHRDEYSWHFEPISPVELPGTQPFLQQGSPTENGITTEMLRPFPRCAMHANYMLRRKEDRNKEQHYDSSSPEFRNRLGSETIRSGYCYSLPIVNNTSTYSQHHGGSDAPADVESSANKRCKSYQVMDDTNVPYEWAFDEINYGQQWSAYAKDETLIAHRNRMYRNEPRHWDREELYRVFS